MRPEDLNHLSPEEKRALLVRLMKRAARDAHSQPEVSPYIPGKQDDLAVNVADLRSQAVLDPEIRFDPPPEELAIEPAHLFVTGATGFLGAFLLHELLAITGAQAHCLVRCANAEDGLARILRNLACYFPGQAYPETRIQPVPGDLSQPLLGLSASRFKGLAEQVDGIYHSGALVNWVYPYARLKPTNVLGTQEVLRLASLGKPKALHFISSISVFPLFSNEESRVISEADSLDHGGVLYSGYAQSKWVAEKIVTLAMERGLPVAIYRPGLITGHSQTGAWNTDDVTSNLIKTWIELRVAPELKAATDMTPVDYVVRAIVHLSRQPESLGQVYHLVNSQAVFLQDLVAWLRANGYRIQSLPYSLWRDKLVELASGLQNASALSVAPLFSLGLSDSAPRAERGRQETLDGLGTLIVSQYADHAVRFDCRNAISRLAGADIACPRIDAEVFGNYLRYFVSSGFLPAPQTVDMA